MLILLIIIIHLCRTVAEYREQNLISELNHFFHFDHNIFLFDPSADINRFVNTSRGQQTPLSLYVFESADNNITGLESLTKVTSKNTFLIVVPGSAIFERNLNLLVRVKRIQRLQASMKIGIFFLDIASDEDLQKLFEWSWKQRIINIFAVSDTIQRFNSHYSLNIFTFNPFGIFTVINVTGTESYDKYFFRQNSNLQNYSFNIHYSTFDVEHDINGKTFRAILGAMNATYRFGHESDFSTSPYIAPKGGKHNLYPVKTMSFVIVVPESLPYSGFSAYLQALATRNLLAHCLITICLIIISLVFFRFMRQRKIVLFESVADILNLLMNDNGYINYRRLSDIELLVIVPLTFAGLIIVNGILSALLSFLTLPILQPQIDTAEDIWNSPFCINTYDTSWTKKAAVELPQFSDHQNWTDKICEVKFTPLEKKVRTFDRSICFMRDAEFANILIKVQKRLNIKGYHIARIGFSGECLSYKVTDDFPFIERFNEIIHRLFSSGLHKLWREQSQIREENDVLKKRLLNHEEVVSEGYEMPSFLLYGWAVSIILFVLEIIWKTFFEQIYVKFRRQ